MHIHVNYVHFVKVKAKIKYAEGVVRPKYKTGIKPSGRSGEIWEAMLDRFFGLLLTKYNTKKRTSHNFTFQ